MHKESNQPFRITKITVTTILFAALAILVGLAATRFAFYVVRLFDPFGRNGDATGHLLTILYILILIAPLVWILRSNYRSQFSILLYVLIQHLMLTCQESVERAKQLKCYVCRACKYNWIIKFIYMNMYM